MRFFYDRRQSVKENKSFSPSARKPAIFVQACEAAGLPIEVIGFKPLTATQIGVAHDSKFVRDVLSCKRENGFNNRSKEVAKSLRWTTGSMTAAALYALESKENCFSPTSGFHHSGYAHAGGFCTFNGLVIAAIHAHRAGAKRIGIIDCDNHAGDGTDQIIKKLGIDFIQHWSFGFQNINLRNSDEWLRDFPKTLFTFEGCDAILYNAGADCHVDDPLGGSLTTEQMRLRDHYLFSTMKRLGIGVAVSLAGGYQTDAHGGIDATLKLHLATVEEAINA